MKVIKNPLHEKKLQMFFEADKDIKKAVATDAIIVKDTTGNKKFSIQHGSNTVKQDFYSPEPSNKVTNSGFETDLTGWSSAQSYTLDDEFSDTLPAGSVNGTLATDGVNTRTVVDTMNYLSSFNGILSNSNYVGGNYIDPSLRYPAITRQSGKLWITSANVLSRTLLTLDKTSGSISPAEQFWTESNIIKSPGGTTSLGSYVSGTNYVIAIVLRSTGAYYYIKGGIYTNWTLLNITSSDATATLYPFIHTLNGQYSVEYSRIPTATFLPTPLAYDTFTRADGAIGTSETTGPDSQTTPALTWTGGAIVSNKNVITPTLGGELSTGNLVVGNWYSITATQTDYFFTGCAIGNMFRATATTGLDVNNKVQLATLSSLFSTVPTSDKDVVISSDVTMTKGTQAGVVTNLDSAGTPANFLIAYHDGTNVKLDKNVGGTYTSLISTAKTYVAGATLRVITYHSDATTLKVRVYYNNAMVGSEQTVTDAGIRENTIHGLFSTYEGNSFDNFTLFARGSDGEYNDIPAGELTASRDTAHSYGGSASMKLVGTSNNANVVTSINVGNTLTYIFIAYVYIDGSTVCDATYAKLWYDTAVIDTTYTDMGSGWTKLSGTLTGVASAKDFGIRVMADKTIWVDTVTLQAGVGATIEVTFENSGSGLANMNFENNVTIGGDVTVGATALTEQNIIALKALL